MSQSSLKQKQNYLRQNIILKGYDPKQFVTFCIDKYGQVNLQIWNLNKLKEIVQLFIISISNNIKDKQKLSIQHNSTSNSQKDQQKKQDNNQFYQNHFQQPINHNNNNIKSNKPYSQTKIISQKQKNTLFSSSDWNMFLSQPLNKIKNSNLPQKDMQTNYQLQFFQTTQKQKKAQVKEKKLSIELKKDLNKKQIFQKNMLFSLQQIQDIQYNKQQYNKNFKSQNKLTKQEKRSSKNNVIEVPPQSYKDKKIKIKVQKAKQDKNLLNVNEIQIINIQQVSRNFLQGEYTLYHIQFLPTQHIIKRKFVDFRKLRSLLQKLYPTIRLPYIQPQGWLVKTSQGKDSDALTRYKWMIIQFLKYITQQNTQLKNSSLVKQFIGITNKRNIQDKDYLKKVFQEYSKMNKLKYVNDLTLVENQIEFQFNPLCQKILKNHENLLHQIQALYQKLKKQLQLMFYNYEILAKSMTDANSTFQSLQNIIKKFSYDNDFCKQIKVYQGLKQMGIKLQSIITEQQALFKNKIYNMIRYEKQNISSIKDFLQTKNKINAEYIKQGNPLNPIIEQQNKILKFSATLSLDQPIKNNKAYLSMQNSFWEHIAISQIENYWKNVRDEVCEQLISICYDQLSTQNENLNFWNGIIKKCAL